MRQSLLFHNDMPRLSKKYVEEEEATCVSNLRKHGNSDKYHFEGVVKGGKGR